MSRVIVNFDEAINGIIVRLPHMVTLEELQEANTRFTELLFRLGDSENFSLLFDTGSHEFESVEALKYARTMLSVEKVLNDCRKFASVAPGSHITHDVKSAREAMFSDYQAAYRWLTR